MTPLRAAASIVAISAATWCVTALPVLDGPPWWNFLGFMVLPAAAAFILAPRTVRFAFIAGALYAALAGVRRMLIPEGNETACEQLSTAALVSLLVPILARSWEWIARITLRTNLKGR